MVRRAVRIKGKVLPTLKKAKPLKKRKGIEEELQYEGNVDLPIAIGSRDDNDDKDNAQENIPIRVSFIYEMTLYHTNNVGIFE